MEYGRFFDPAWLTGETTLVKMHTGYKVDGDDKRAAHEIAVGEPGDTTTGVIYVTRDLEHDGVRYLCSKQGYSVLMVMTHPDGKDLYGAHVPLQSYRQADGSYLYAAGTQVEAAAFEYPQPPEHPRGTLRVGYWPGVERAAARSAWSCAPRAGRGRWRPRRRRSCRWAGCSTSATSSSRPGDPPLGRHGRAL
ncbi:MAG: hypothetical protein IPQ24_16140 [Anaeromyxobacter sp.]|nr:hypothetical protein [Anaeromyxobacter sp.]